MPSFAPSPSRTLRRPLRPVPPRAQANLAPMAHSRPWRRPKSVFGTTLCHGSVSPAAATHGSPTGDPRPCGAGLLCSPYGPPPARKGLHLLPFRSSGNRASPAGGRLPRAAIIHANRRHRGHRPAPQPSLASAPPAHGEPSPSAMVTGGMRLRSARDSETACQLARDGSPRRRGDVGAGRHPTGVQPSSFEARLPPWPAQAHTAPGEGSPAELRRKVLVAYGVWG